LEAITEIDDVTQGVSFDRFASDRRTRLLTERLLEIVCEPSRTIPDKIKQEEPGIDWRKMINFANLLRHAYHETEAEIVWDIIQKHLPPLRSFVERRIRASDR
jgi:uncharacterized protein with HEPN domain